MASRKELVELAKAGRTLENAPEQLLASLDRTTAQAVASKCESNLGLRGQLGRGVAAPNLVRMYSVELSGDSFTVPGPLLTKKSPSVGLSMPFHLRNTGSGAEWRAMRLLALPAR